MLNLKPFRPFYGHIKHYKFTFVLGVLSGLVYAVSSGFGIPTMMKTVFPILFEGSNAENTPQWLRTLVDQYFQNSQDGLLVTVCLLLPVIMLIRTASAFCNGYCMTYTGVGVLQEIQKTVFHKLQHLPLAFFQQYKSGDIAARTMADPMALKTVIVNVSNDLIKQPFTFISAIGYLAYAAYQNEGVMVALAGALSIPICVFPIRKIGKSVARKAKKMSSMAADLNSDTIESIQSPLEIRAYNLQDQQISQFKAHLAKIFKINMRQCRSNLLLSPLIEFITTLGLTLSLYLGASSGMRLEDFLGLATALFISYEPLKKLGNINNKLRSAEASLARIQLILQAKETVPEAENPISIETPVRGQLEFKQVGFTYEGNTAPALEGLNTTVKPGEIIALVGHSGAGKTTFANLIPRFFDPGEGEILLDGVNIKQYKKHDLRSQIAIVPQTPLLFNTSILENIRIGRLTATEDEVKAAARLAYADEFIMDQPDKYQTIVGERGNALSGGQRQRIALARAFLSQAPILILDEATSALDNDSEYKIHLALANYAQDKTVFMIAHRFSSLRAATRTFFFHSSKLVATGEHEELLLSQPAYKELYEKSTGE